MFNWLWKKLFGAKRYGLYVSSYEIMEQLETIRGYGGGVLDCQSSIVDFTGKVVSKGFTLVYCPSEAVQIKLESIFKEQGHEVARVGKKELAASLLTGKGLSGVLIRSHIKRVSGG